MCLCVCDGCLFWFVVFLFEWWDQGWKGGEGRGTHCWARVVPKDTSVSSMLLAI